MMMIPMKMSAAVKSAAVKKRKEELKMDAWEKVELDSESGRDRWIDID